MKNKYPNNRIKTSRLKPRKYTSIRVEVVPCMKRISVSSAVFEAESFVFRSGSKGFYGQSKIENHTTGERYQVTFTAVLIGSKPKKSGKVKK